VSVSLVELSVLGHLIQCAGVLGIALLFYLLHQIIPVRYFAYWMRAWALMFVSLASLQLSFRGFAPPVFEFLYFFGEYFFALMLWAGYAAYSGVRVRSVTYWLLVPAAIWSLYLAVVAEHAFGHRFATHALVFASAMLPALYQVSRFALGRHRRWAKRVAVMAVAFLVLDFYANGFSLARMLGEGSTLHIFHNAFQSVLDVILEILLAFSMLLLAAVKMQARMARVNKLLESERDSLAMLAHRDALTSCFNRHALIKLEERINTREGLLIMVDINDLKTINDSLGHAIGDKAIMKVAEVLRCCLRGHDHIFRYGGDEFLVVAFDFPAHEAQQRFAEVDRMLAGSESIETFGRALTISYGMQPFDEGRGFESVLAQADKNMYKSKLLRQAKQV
jgi:diguanylate cyclase (GGDEF)-like protein